MHEKQFYIPTDQTTIERLDVLTEHIMYLESIVKELLIQIRAPKPADTADHKQDWVCDPTEEIGEEYLTATSKR